MQYGYIYIDQYKRSAPLGEQFGIDIEPPIISKSTACQCFYCTKFIPSNSLVSVLMIILTAYILAIFLVSDLVIINFVKLQYKLTRIIL